MSTPREWLPITRCGSCGATGTRPGGTAQGVDIVGCTGCGLFRFAAVAPPDAVYQDGYHTGTTGFGFDYAAWSGTYDEALAEQRLAWLEEFVSRGHLVDVGGGLGYFVAVAARRGWDAELLEPVAAAVDHARSLGLKVQQGGLADLAARPAEFDAVALNHTLEHIADAKDALGAARAALRSGGVLWVEVPNYSSFSRRLQGDSWLGWQSGEHIYLFTPPTLRDLLERAGFEVLALRSWVPGWDGLDPDGYAHMLGLRPALATAVSATRRVRRRDGDREGNGSAAGGDGPAAGGGVRGRALPPIREERGVRRLMFDKGFRLLARVEERFGVGTNIQAVARPRGNHL